MSKIKCNCGNILHLGEIPDRNEYLFLSDIEFDEIFKDLDEEKIYLNTKRFYKCPVCERLFIFWDNNKNKFVMYKKENL
jgi:hypothetical protein